ncbi:MAG: substrate-binding domain-containing protein [Thermoplasmata archaeon]|nr:substrate-binding domain-containing protein [Thermoplasmata archaeon]
MSRLKPSRFYKNEVLPHAIGTDEVVVVCNIEGVPSLTLRQITDIFAGEVANWRDLGGPDEVIHVFVRGEDSGTRAVFDRAMKNVRKWSCASSAKVCETSEIMATRIRSTHGSIGYIGTGRARALEGDGDCHIIVPVRQGRAEKGSSKLCVAPRTINILTDGNPSGVSGAFLSWVTSDEGQEIVAQEFTPLPPEAHTPALEPIGPAEIVVGGSTSMTRTLIELASAYTARYPDIRVSVRDGGSMTADADTEHGDLDLGATAGGYERRLDKVSVFGFALTVAAIVCIMLPLSIILFYWNQFAASLAEVGTSMWYIMELMFGNVEMVSYIFMLFGGILIYRNNKLPYVTRASLCGLILGAAFLIRNLDFAESATYSGISFVISLLTLIVGAATLIASFATMFGYNHYGLRLVELALVMIFIDFWPLYNVYRLEGNFAAYLSYIDRIPLIISYVIFIIVMLDKSVQVPSANKRMGFNIDTIGDMAHSSWASYITPADLTLLKAAIAERTDITVEIRGESHPKSLSIINVPGHEYMQGTVEPRRGGSFMDGFRFDIVNVCLSDSGGLLRIYGLDGVFVDLVVKEMPHSKTIREMLSRGHRRDTVYIGPSNRGGERG